jgi:hypothetical protein
VITGAHCSGKTFLKKEQGQSLLLFFVQSDRKPVTKASLAQKELERD